MAWGNKWQRVEVRLEPEDEGFAVYEDGCWRGFVWPDVFGGWRPHTPYGHCLTEGRPASLFPLHAAARLVRKG